MKMNSTKKNESEIEKKIRNIEEVQLQILKNQKILAESINKITFVLKNITCDESKKITTDFENMYL